MHQKEDQKESQGSVSSVTLGSKSALNFPFTYLQKAGVFVQKTVTTTGVCVCSQMNSYIVQFHKGYHFLYCLQSVQLLMVFFFLWVFFLVDGMQYYVFYNHNNLSQKEGYWKQNTVPFCNLSSLTCSDIVIPGANNSSNTQTKINAGESIHIIRGTKGNNFSLHPLSAVRD